MKTHLLLLFLAASTAEEAAEDYDELGNYPLFEVRFQDIVFIDPLPYDLLMNKVAAISCYKRYKDTFKGYAKKYQTDIQYTQEFFMALDVKYRWFGMDILKTFKTLAKDLVECHDKIWNKLKKKENLRSLDTIIDCKKKVSDHLDKYEADLKKIDERINKYRMSTEMNKFMNDVEGKFKRTTEKYKLCVEKYPKN